MTFDATPREPERWFVEAHKLLSSETYPQIRLIQEVVAKHYGVTRDDLISQRREKRVTLARHIAIYLARHMTLSSLPKIGRQFGDRDHTTTRAAVIKIEKLIEADAKLSSTIDHLFKKIEAHG